ncbi:hypothetical protein ACH6EH_07460 [Paenibacillus sp. JSM ZJ436]
MNIETTEQQLSQQNIESVLNTTLSTEEYKSLLQNALLKLLEEKEVINE